MIDFITSLDGFGAAEGWPGLWGMGGPEYLGWLEEQAEYPFTYVMGAHTYRLMSAFVANGEPFTESLTAAPKIVCSNTLTEPLTWANTKLVSGDTVGAIRAIKDSDVGPLHTLGSVSLCRSLLRAGLVDRFRVVLFPVINGATGRDRIYDGYPDVALDLVERRTLDGRLQLLEYIPTVLSGPPSQAAAASGGSGTPRVS
jgi:dihydrofolate reductase